MMHAAEAGEFGESLVRLELSRAGWLLVLPCRGVAIDVLAVAPSGRRIGISVKCRDRGAKNEHESTFIFRDKPGKRTANAEIARFREICDLLAVEPWIAVVTITPEFCYAYLTELQHYEEKYSSCKSRNKAWNNTTKWRDRYADDSAVLGNKKPGIKGVWTL
jgi:hypothetical protein